MAADNLGLRDGVRARSLGNIGEDSGRYAGFNALITGAGQRSLGGNRRKPSASGHDGPPSGGNVLDQRIKWSRHRHTTARSRQGR